MKYVSLILSEDAAHECVHALGELGALQFTDLNPEQTAFQRRYVTYVKRCDELERKLRFILKEIETFGLPIMPSPVIDLETTSPLRPNTAPRSSSAILDVLESELEKYEGQLLELSSYSDELTAKYNEKIEFQECLEKGRNFFETEASAVLSEFDAGSLVDSTHATPITAEDGMQPLLGNTFTGLASQGIQRTVDSDMKFSSTVGVLNADERARFERMLFRSTRGNCLVRFCQVERPIADAASGKPENKMVFIIFFKSEVIGAIIDRICGAFGARQYPVPDHATLGDATKLRTMIHETTVELADAREVLIKNRELRLALCSRLAQRYHEWKRVVLREKLVYHVLNLFRADVSGMLRSEAWIIAAEEPEARAVVARIHAVMDLAGASMLAPVPLPWPSPPTSFKTNEFTYAFQEFVDTYGIPRYKEINPAPFTAVTFPFLFGMMYGDIGHGTCILLGGAYLIATYPGYRKTDSDGNEMLGSVYAARYMLTAMGACAVYVGLVYNDCFSLALAIFDSGYRWEGAEDGVAGSVSNGAVANSTSPYGSSEAVYPFGVDPVWHISENELLFFNSMKMKSAVIFGVLQMTGGILLKGLNALFFGEGVVFCLEFLPMIIFDCCLFFYMVVLIFTKWAIDWDWRQLQGSCRDGITYDGRPCSNSDPLNEKCALDYGGDTGGCAPPNLINQLINIALNPGVVDEPMYDGQGSTQSALLAIAFLSVPILLLGKPIYVYFQQHGTQSPVSHQHAGTQIEMDHENIGPTESSDPDATHSLSEVLIHQSIETIEFVLGMVSNTASYLRLWALSLAHTELAQVFWEKTMRTAINTNNGFFVFVAYSIFAVVTAAVLLAMDLLECFLHALRLHWVEFQNKFYKADGIRFAPFAFSANTHT
jgi:V-type H+-transporting ATPase subunit a